MRPRRAAGSGARCDCPRRACCTTIPTGRRGCSSRPRGPRSSRSRASSRATCPSSTTSSSRRASRRCRSRTIASLRRCSAQRSSCGAVALLALPTVLVVRWYRRRRPAASVAEEPELTPLERAIRLVEWTGDARRRDGAAGGARGPCRRARRSGASRARALRASAGVVVRLPACCASSGSRRRREECRWPCVAA